MDDYTHATGGYLPFQVDASTVVLDIKQGACLHESIK